MNFFYEYETVASDGSTYNIEVEGEHHNEEYETFTEVTSVCIFDDTGDLLDKDHLMFAELYTEALEREYEVENHYTDTSFYGTHDEDYSR